MGAWGAGAFQNDGALDWLDELVASGDFSGIGPLLTRVGAMPLHEYLDTDDGECARAAAEIVAASYGYSDEGTPADAREKASALHESLRRDVSLRSLAAAAVKRVAVDKSELHEVWMEDASSASLWSAANASLLSRLVEVPG